MTLNIWLLLLSASASCVVFRGVRGYADAQKDKANLKASIQVIRDVCERDGLSNFHLQWIKKFIDESKVLEIE